MNPSHYGNSASAQAATNSLEQPDSPMGETLLLAVSRLNTARSIIDEIESKLNGPRPVAVNGEKSSHIAAIGENVHILENGLANLVDRLSSIAAGL